MRLSSTSILLALFATSINAQNIDYSILCTEDKNTGLAWQSGRWLEVSFETQKYRVAKYEINESTEIFGCELHNKKDGFEMGDIKLDYGCYEVTEFSEELVGYGTWCWESHGKSSTNENTYALRSVTCNQTIYVTFVFLPGGSFHRSYIHRFLDKNTSTNDTMHLSVGSCSQD